MIYTKVLMFSLSSCFYCVLAVALGVSFIINMFVVSVFAQVEKLVISIIRFGKVVNGIVFHYEKIIVPHETETQNQW